MNQFKFEGSLKVFCIALIAIGLISMGATWAFDDDYHSRFWSNILHNSVFFTGIAFIALFFYAACVTALAGWHTVFKRLWEAFFLFLIVGIVFMLIIGIGTMMEWHHLYHWADEESVANDKILLGKSAFLNTKWYILGTLIIVGVWFFVAFRIRKLSVQEDSTRDYNQSIHSSIRKWSAFILPIGGFGSAALIWLWVMSVDAHWYSTLFAWYSAASWLVAMLALTILILTYLKSKGYYSAVSMEHYHDIGKYLFAFSIFWTYLWFSQYMLIWYANVGEETTYFKTRVDEYPVLFYSNLIINFLLPFFVLMRNDTKRKYGTMVFVAIFTFLGHWLDYFLMIKPGVRHTVHELKAHAADHAEEAAHAVHHFSPGFDLPGFLEIGTLLGFLGLFLFFVFTALGRAPLIGVKDPYIAESLHHHT